MPDPYEVFRQDVHGEAADKFTFGELTNLFAAAFTVVFHHKAYAVL